MLLLIWVKNLMMIDWISCLIPYAHREPINDGNVTSVNPDGVVEWSTEKRLSVQGSYSSTIQIRSEHKDFPCSHIYLTGNPVKFLQGHNVWGSSDLLGLITATLERTLQAVKPELLTPDLPEFVNLATISRVDLTSMYDLGNDKRVNAWLTSAEQSANLKHRGRGHFSGNTLYFGKKSKRWSLKLYHKGSELKAHKVKGYNPTQLEFVTNYADRALRSEVVIRGLELDKTGFRSVSDWDEFTAETLYTSYVSRLEFSENMKTITDDSELENLPPRLTAPFQLWREGFDLKTMYSRATWYRYRKEILEAIKVDISLQSPKNRPEASNVVPLIQILEAKPMSIPDWAHGTELYFEPNHYRVA